MDSHRPSLQGYTRRRERSGLAPSTVALRARVPLQSSKNTYQSDESNESHEIGESELEHTDSATDEGTIRWWPPPPPPPESGRFGIGVDRATDESTIRWLPPPPPPPESMQPSTGADSAPDESTIRWLPPPPPPPESMQPSTEADNAKTNQTLALARDKASTSFQITISDDRSLGSEFDLNNRILTALRRSVADEQTQPPNIHANDQKTIPIPGAEFMEAVPPPASPNRPPKTTGMYWSGPGVPRYEPERDLTMPHPNRIRIGHKPSNKAVTGNHFDGGKSHSSDMHRTDADHSLSDALRVIRRHLGIQDQSLLTIDTLRGHPLMAKSLEPRVQLIYRVSQLDDVKMYLDAPQWLAGENSRKEALVGNLPVRNLPSYLSKHPEVKCLIYRDYRPPSPRDEDSDNGNPESDEQPKHNSEGIEIHSEDLTTAIDAFWGYFKFDLDEGPSTKETVLSSPYLPIFHTRGKAISTFLDTLHNTQRQHFKLFLDYILTEYEAEYDIVDNMMSKGTIMYKYVKYLFKPGDIVVQGSDRGIRGYLCTTWVQGGLKDYKSEHLTYYLQTWNWEFDGVFTRDKSTLTLRLGMKDPSDKIIDDMEIRPLAYVNDSIKDRLRRRGAWFWKCRFRHMVSYHEEDDQEFQDSGHGRYMIDMKTYSELHTRKEQPSSARSRGDLGPDILKQDDPPDENFNYLTPPTIKGFNLKKKKWSDLEVDKIGPVIWNKQAFKHLVMKEKTKRLIEALISNQIEEEKSTDLITGKGNGLIMLLHGGPGTGKTLTAESVAEIAEKPLYPVTCGDIGIVPEEVENYLESVLHIGKTWGCVVLLDEADVFLEQRSLEDLQRNALVSVFLRVLEYYDGILILTSNRVGTFDEAFKSRIQLALHYKSLSEHQRTQIWRNFITRLEEINEEGIDFTDLKDHIEELAKHKLNGREIRNVITTARQYARWERQQPNKQRTLLDYKMMEEVIETAAEFDQYIEKLNGGYTFDQLAEDDGLRLEDAT
ncbi:hypothetical protein F4859DRAFT_500237 [Xylaria cf. heliscus]|nr:hypothetical protein F4859DRAFT_500237 [Xylaria cf. heliscus]